MDAIERRHYKVGMPYPTEAGLEELEIAFKWLKKVCRRNGLYPGSLEPWTPEKVIETRCPAKRRIYSKAFERLQDRGSRKQDAYNHAFVKHEKGPVNIKPPRLVQHPSPENCAELAQYLAPLEHSLYQLKWHGVPLFGKGLNQRQTAQAIVDVQSQGSKYFMLDHSSFDAHVSGPLLSLEHRFYLWLYKGDARLQRLLSYQTCNRVFFPDGLRLRTPRDLWGRGRDHDVLLQREWPGRMSGCFNTGLGNSVINTLVLYAFGLRNGLAHAPNFGFCVNGDDCWGIVPADFKMPSYEQFKDWGMSTKLEGVGYIPEEVAFCQARPVELSDGWMMVRDFRRVLNRIPYTIREYAGKAWDGYAKGIADCEMALGRGVPILHSIATSLSQQFKDAKTLVHPSDEREYSYAQKMLSDRHIDDRARASYSVAWNVSIAEQLALEEAIGRHQWRKVGGHA